MGKASNVNGGDEAGESLGSRPGSLCQNVPIEGQRCRRTFTHKHSLNEEGLVMTDNPIIVPATILPPTTVEEEKD